MTNTRLTLHKVCETLKSHPAISFIKRGGEFRITLKLDTVAKMHPDMSRSELVIKAEEIAAYETDLLAAGDTALQMSAWAKNVIRKPR